MKVKRKKVETQLAEMTALLNVISTTILAMQGHHKAIHNVLAEYVDRVEDVERGLVRDFRRQAMAIERLKASQRVPKRKTAGSAQ